MSKIYLPSEYLSKPCYQVNQNYIRVFETTNMNTQNTIYDIYINQDYQIKQGTTNFSSSTQCDTLNTYTDDIFYRTDFDKILLIFIILFIFIINFPVKLFKRIFRRLL